MSTKGTAGVATPGPWRVMFSGRTASGHVKEDARHYSVHGTLPALVPGHASGFFGQPTDIEIAVIKSRNPADRALIAAAPDLYAVALAVDAFDKADYTDLTDIRIALTALTAQARAALASAGQ